MPNSKMTYEFLRESGVDIKTFMKIKKKNMTASQLGLKSNLARRLSGDGIIKEVDRVGHTKVYRAGKGFELFESWYNEKVAK